MRASIKNNLLEALFGAAIGAAAAAIVYGVYSLLSLVIGAKIAVWLVYGGLALLTSWHVAKNLWPKRVAKPRLLR